MSRSVRFGGVCVVAVAACCASLHGRPYQGVCNELLKDKAAARVAYEAMIER